MKTKILVLCLTLLSIAVFPYSSVAETSTFFTDVSQNHPNYKAIYFLYKTDVLQGYAKENSDEREYRPENLINRAEFLKIILKSYLDSHYKEYTPCFPDIPEDAWYKNYVCLAKELEIVDGYPDGTFKPERNINEAETLKILGELTSWTLEDREANEEWYVPYSNYAEEKNLLISSSLDKTMTRGDIAEFVFREIQIQTLQLNSYSEEKIDTLYTYFNIDGNIDADIDTDTDTTTSDSTFNINISMKNSFPVSDTEEQEIEIYLYDNVGTPLENRSLALETATGIDYSKTLEVTELGDGYYSSSFSSTLAGDYALLITDNETGQEEYQYFTVTPEAFDHAEIIEVIDQTENLEANKAMIKAVSKDKFENVIPYSVSQNNLGAFTTLGEISDISHTDNGIFTFEITANDFGTAQIYLIDETVPSDEQSLLEENTEITFYPAVAGNASKGISQGTEEIEVPISVFMPQSLGSLGSYNLTLEYDPEQLEYKSISDPDDSDYFDVPSIEVDQNSGLIYLSQTNANPEIKAREVVPAASVTFIVSVDAVGSGVISIPEAVITDTDGEEEGFLEKIAGGFFRWWYEIKPVKDLCIDAFIFPPSAATQASVNRDIAHVNRIFAVNTSSCTCPFSLNASVNSVTTMTAADWSAVDVNGNNRLDANELDTIATNHPGRGSCFPVYYANNLLNDWWGVSWTNPPRNTNGIGMDDDADTDHRTLAHELAHQITKNVVTDPNNPPTSTTQGADTPNNLMNYAQTGDNLTKIQCDLIDKALP